MSWSIDDAIFLTKFLEKKTFYSWDLHSSKSGQRLTTWLSFPSAIIRSLLHVLCQIFANVFVRRNLDCFTAQWRRWNKRTTIIGLRHKTQSFCPKYAKQSFFFAKQKTVFLCVVFRTFEVITTFAELDFNSVPYCFSKRSFTWSESCYKKGKKILGILMQHWVIENCQLQRRH